MKKEKRFYGFLSFLIDNKKNDFSLHLKWPKKFAEGGAGWGRMMRFHLYQNQTKRRYGVVHVVLAKQFKWHCQPFSKFFLTRSLIIENHCGFVRHFSFNSLLKVATFSQSDVFLFKMVSERKKRRRKR